MAMVGVIAAAFFFIVMLALPAASGGTYDWRTSAISSGVYTRLGPLQAAAFVVLGIGMLALGIQMADQQQGSSSTVAAVLVSIWGASTLVCAIAPIDRGDEQTTKGNIHMGAAFLGFLAVIVAMFVASFAFMDTDGGDSVGQASLVLAVAAVIALILMVVEPWKGWVGLVQRIFITLLLAWAVIVGINLM